MSEVVIFAGSEVFLPLNVRTNLIRVPQVIVALKQAESWIEELGIKDVSLMAFFLYEDRLFQRDDELRRLVSGVAQLALFNRYMRNREMPELFMGPVERETIFSVVAKSKGLQEWVQTHPWTVRKLQSMGVNIEDSAIGEWIKAQAQQSSTDPRDWGRLAVKSVPTLAQGFVQAPISIFKKATPPAPPTREAGSFSRRDLAALTAKENAIPTYEVVAEGHPSYEAAIQELVDGHNAFRFTVVGPGLDIRQGMGSEGLSELIEVVDSVDWDPLLTWMRPALQTGLEGSASSLH